MPSLEPPWMTASTAAPSMSIGRSSSQLTETKDDKDKDKIIDGYCWYHRTHKHRARKCLEGCKKYVDLPAKNATGGQ